MKYYQVKVRLTREGKLKNENYIVKCSQGVAIAEAIAELNLSGFDPDVIVTDVNSKAYDDVFISEDSTGIYYECTIELIDLESKNHKETYLQESFSVKDAEQDVTRNVMGEYVIKSIKEVNIIDYFIQED